MERAPEGSEFRRRQPVEPEMPRWRKRLAVFEGRVAALPWRKISGGFGVVLVLVLGGLGWVYRAPLVERGTVFVAQATGATVQSIVVEGMVYTGRDDMQTALGLAKGSSLVGFDAGAARGRIEQLPWVRLASVERRLPDAVKVVVYEHVPLARVVQDGAIWVINQEGKAIVADADNRFAGLPLLQGEGAAQAAGPLFTSLAAWPQLMSQLREAKRLGDRRWDLRFVSGVVVQLPEDTGTYGPAMALPMLVKLEEARHVLTLPAGEVDLRLPDRVVLRIPPEVKDSPVTNKPPVTG